MKADLLNAAALGVALAAAMLGALWQEGEPLDVDANVIAAMPAAPGATELTDARGKTIAVKDYQRIASLNTVADHVLLHLVEPDRLIGITGYTADTHPEQWRFGERPGVSRSDQIEEILSLRPELVVTSKFADEAFMSRLREAGIAVFDLGEMRGVQTTLQNIRTLGALLDQRERAAALERRYLRELAALDAAVPDEQMPAGIYLSVYGDSYFGGSSGSSYADMLRYAGVRDLAAEHGYREWPRYSPEQLLAMDPTLIITQQDMGAVICRHSVLRDLAACDKGGRVIEVPGTYHSDPGLGLVEAAAGILALVHPDRAIVTP
ncbi:MAG: ABC transporter substrate-binding protein [Myxococcota bacterium]